MKRERWYIRVEVGEIVVCNRYLAQGYWNNPDLTTKSFETNPLDSNIRIYRTGDLGRWRSDGTLEHMGRKGRRIKLRGYNIEPFQVERELMRQPGVRDAIVLAHDGAPGDELCLVGYVVAPPNASPSTIRKGLAERLPSYMVPSHIVSLDSFPLTNSGKVDRNALPPPHREEAHQASFRAPSNGCEHELLAIWQEVLKIPRIGIDDDFFELGGTSLQALTLILEIEAQLGCNLSPTDILEAPTIAHLAEAIRASTGINVFRSLIPLRASGTGSPLFLVSPGYHALFFYRQMLKDLKSDRPVFGLQPLPLDGQHRIPRTIESMAVDYVTEIRRVQPHGPYFLAGYSFGGRVSLEIAQQLVREGEPVSFLGLIDTSLHDKPVEGWPRLSEAAVLSRKVRRVNGFQDLLYSGVRSMRSRVRYLPKALWYRLLDAWFRLGRSLPNEQRSAYYQWLCKHANRGYTPKSYAGHITMFAGAGNSEQQRAHWGPLARDGLTVLEMPAGHHDMVASPHSKLLAEHFDACLNAAVR
jgi:thioesterase domain-containing protein/acyl carrier protein